MENQELQIQNSYLTQKLAHEILEASKYAARCEILAQKNSQLSEELKQYKEKERMDKARDTLDQSKVDELNNK